MKITKRQLRSLIKEGMADGAYEAGYNDAMRNRPHGSNPDMRDLDPRSYDHGFDKGTADRMDMQRPSGTRGFYESIIKEISVGRSVAFPFSEIADWFQERGYKVKKAHAGDDRGKALFHMPSDMQRDFSLGYYVDVKYEYGTFYFYWYFRGKEPNGRIKVMKPGGGKPRWEVGYIMRDLEIVMDEIDYEISVHDAEGTHPFDLGLPPSKFAFKG